MPYILYVKNSKGWCVVVNITLKYFCFCYYLSVLGAKQCIKKVIIAMFVDAFEGLFRISIWFGSFSQPT